MPRIPSREEPYHSVAKCNRHWKTKREFVTKAANKASHVDGSHYLLVCVTPKGNIEVHASEHFYDDASQTRMDGVVNWDVLRRRATMIQAKNEERWVEIERQEKRFGGEEEDGFVGLDELIDDEDIKGSASHHGSAGDLSSDAGVDASSVQGRHTPAPGQHVFSAAKASPPRPIGSVTVTPASLEKEYVARFEHLGQSVCANILKAWIKVIEPKKQTKFPYKDKKGNPGRPPPWWPRDMRHIEPDHQHKDERPRLLAHILKISSWPRPEHHALIAAQTCPELREVTISRLHFATAEIGSSIPPRQHYELRQIYLIAKECRKANEDWMSERRKRGLEVDESMDAVEIQRWSELTIDFYEKPPPGVTGPGKRGYDAASMGGGDFNPMMADKENIDYERAIKRSKHMVSPLNDLHHPGHVPLSAHQNVYAVPPYSMGEPQTPHTPGYPGWSTVAPITIPGPPASAGGPTSAPPTAHLGGNGQQQQQQAYYAAAGRPVLASEVSYSYPASNASYTPPQSQQTLHSATAPTSQSNGTTTQPPYGSTQGSYFYPSSASTPGAAATPYGAAGTTPPQYAAYGPYEQQAFVNDVVGLSA